MTTMEQQAEKDRAIRVLEEALTGTSSKSKNSLIGEALAAIRNIELCPTESTSEKAPGPTR